MHEVARKAHFIGLCGIGMSAVAKMLMEEGWIISGSDQGFYPPVSEYLTKISLSCATPHKPENIPPGVELIVIGKHAKLTPEQNAEVREAFRLRDEGKVTIKSFPEVLSRLSARTTNIVITGSYGKSTTASLLAWQLIQNGIDISYFLGVIPHGLMTSSHIGASRYFILEGDEYASSSWDSTSKFMYYNPYAVLLTSCEHDHLNIFKSEREYVERYIKLVGQIPPEGLLVVCTDGVGVEAAMEAAKCRVVTYAVKSNNANWMAKHITAGTSTKFSILRSDVNSAPFEIETPLFGEHNVENLLGASVMALELGLLTPSQIQSSALGFPGLKRRLELKSTLHGVTIYEDLSSSRPKAASTLAAVRSRYPERRIVCIFQPYTFSFRSRHALKWYPKLFEDANEVIVFAPPDLFGLPSSEKLSHLEIYESIVNGNSTPCHMAVNGEEVLSILCESVHPGDILLLMSSGSLGESINDAISSYLSQLSLGVRR